MGSIVCAGLASVDTSLAFLCKHFQISVECFLFCQHGNTGRHCGPWVSSEAVSVRGSCIREAQATQLTGLGWFVCWYCLHCSGHECYAPGLPSPGPVLFEKTKASPCLGGGGGSYLGLANSEVEDTSGPTKVGHGETHQRDPSPC